MEWDSSFYHINALTISIILHQNALDNYELMMNGLQTQAGW